MIFIRLHSSTKEKQEDPAQRRLPAVKPEQAAGSDYQKKKHVCSPAAPEPITPLLPLPDQLSTLI
jgi:hypothetical protein